MARRRGKRKEVLASERRRNCFFLDCFGGNYPAMFSAENEIEGKVGYQKRVLEWRMEK